MYVMRFLMFYLMYVIFCLMYIILYLQLTNLFYRYFIKFNRGSSIPLSEYRFL